MEITLAVIKPHVVQNTVALKNLRKLLNDNFQVLHFKEIFFNKTLSEHFYAEHKGKFFYNRLTTFMGSGPCQAFVLQSKDCITKWRNLMGPTKVYKAIYSHPECIRAQFGLSDTRNACHGSDSTASAIREINIIFPELKIKHQT